MPLYQKSYAIDEKEGNPIGMSIESGNLAYVLWIIGALRESEFYARRALAISRKFGCERIRNNASTGTKHVCDIFPNYLGRRS